MINKLPNPLPKFFHMTRLMSVGVSPMSRMGCVFVSLADLAYGGKATYRAKPFNLDNKSTNT